MADLGNDDVDLPDVVLSSVDRCFEEAVPYFAARVAEGAVSNDDALTMYGFYKQATEGRCTKPKPLFFDRVARAKWSAWYNVQDMSTDAARLAYVHTLVKMDPSFLESLLKSLGEGRKGGGPGGPVFSCLADGGEDEGADADAPEAGSLHVLASSSSAQGAELEEALAGGVDVNSRDSEGCTPLHWAADRGNLQAVALLLKTGADVNARDNDGLTPLHYAALCEQEAAARALVEAGADVGAMDKEGLTPAENGPASWDWLQR